MKVGLRAFGKRHRSRVCESLPSAIWCTVYKSRSWYTQRKDCAIHCGLRSLFTGIAFQRLVTWVSRQKKKAREANPKKKGKRFIFILTSYYPPDFIKLSRPVEPQSHVSVDLCSYMSDM